MAHGTPPYLAKIHALSPVSVSTGENQIMKKVLVTENVVAHLGAGVGTLSAREPWASVVKSPQCFVETAEDPDAPG